MKVKFCGMTNYEDVKSAIDLGVDFIGFVFYKKSKRYASFEETKRIVEKVKGEVKTVGVFFGCDRKTIIESFKFYGFDYAQVYEDVEGMPVIRVYRINDGLPNVVQDGLVLFDVYTEKGGGSGRSFDWELLKDCPYKDRLFVAGGVSVNNVKFLNDLGVFGVDLVSSVEEYPGKKSFSKMKEFMETVRGLK